MKQDGAMDWDKMEVACVTRFRIFDGGGAGMRETALVGPIGGGDRTPVGPSLADDNGRLMLLTPGQQPGFFRVLGNNIEEVYEETGDVKIYVTLTNTHRSAIPGEQNVVVQNGSIVHQGVSANTILGTQTFANDQSEKVSEILRRIHEKNIETLTARLAELKDK